MQAIAIVTRNYILAIYVICSKTIALEITSWTIHFSPAGLKVYRLFSSLISWSYIPFPLCLHSPIMLSSSWTKSEYACRSRTLHFCRYFREMRDREKHRMEHTEIYSTALWHLQEDVELSALAQELTKVTNTTRVARYKTQWI